MPDSGFSPLFPDGAANHQSCSKSQEILHHILALQTWDRREFNKTDVGSQDKSDQKSCQHDGQKQKSDKDQRMNHQADSSGHFADHQEQYHEFRRSEVCAMSDVADL